MLLDFITNTLNTSVEFIYFLLRLLATEFIFAKARNPERSFDISRTILLRNDSLSAQIICCME
jgi:hypothetical protein